MSTRTVAGVGVQVRSSTTVGSPSGPRHDRQRLSWSSGPMLLPAAVLLLILFLAPIAYSFVLGFTNLKLVGPTSLDYELTGLDNLRKLVDDAVFHRSIYLTAIFVLGSGVVMATGVALTLAIAMQKALPGARLLTGGIVMVAYTLPQMTIAIVWYAASTPDGAITGLFGQSDSDFLNNFPMLMVSVANAWSLTGLAMLMFNAALRNIPADIIEAAQLENASGLQRFMKITLPLLKPTIVTTILLISLMSLANFTVIYLMTGGGPGTDTMILPVYAYQQGFLFNDLAYGALIGNVTVIIGTIFSALFVYFSRSKAK